MFSKKNLLIFLFLLSGINVFAARYSSSSCTQLNSGATALPGSTGNQIIRVDLVGTGNNSGQSWNLSSIAFSLTNNANYSAAKLYYGTTTTFSNATLIQTISNPGSTATFSSYSTTPTNQMRHTITQTFKTNKRNTSISQMFLQQKTS